MSIDDSVVYVDARTSLLIVRVVVSTIMLCFFFQAEDGIRDLVRSRGLGDVYKRQDQCGRRGLPDVQDLPGQRRHHPWHHCRPGRQYHLSLIHI